jgi:hypothetical protein
MDAGIFTRGYPFTLPGNGNSVTVMLCKGSRVSQTAIARTKYKEEFALT